MSIRDLVFSPLLYLEYPYHWNEYDENGKITKIVFSKKPRYTLLEYIEMKNKLSKIKEGKIYEYMAKKI